MEEREVLYNQETSSFLLQLFVTPETIVKGEVIVELANAFLDELVVSGYEPQWLWTKRGRPDDAKLNIGDFSERRWKDAIKKTLSGEYGVLHIRAQNTKSPSQWISLGTQFNPTGGSDTRIIGRIGLSCSVSCLRQLGRSPEKIESILKIGKAAWNGLNGGAAYGYGNLAVLPQRTPFVKMGVINPDYKFSLEMPRPPAERPHPIPVAVAGNAVDGNLEFLYCSGKGIKGAFWANFLTALHAGMAGGEQTIKDNLAGGRVERLDDGGLLVVATPSPIPEDSEENRQRFLSLYRVLQPAFFSRLEISAGKRDLLGYFYREKE